MPAPNQPSRRLRVPRQDPGPLRLRMVEPRAGSRLDGVWWPRSRDLAVELPDLVDHFRAEQLGRIVRVQISPADWDTSPRHVLVSGGYVKVGSFTQDSTHVVHLTTSDRTLLHVLVVPPAYTRDQGDEALRTAVEGGHTRSASELLEHAVQQPARDAVARLSTRRGSTGVRQ